MFESVTLNEVPCPKSDVVSTTINIFSSKNWSILKVGTPLGEKVDAIF